MKYYDIHTHRLSEDPDVISIQNLIIRENPSCTFLLDGVGENVFFSAGIHPWYIHTIENQLALLQQLLLHPSVIAVGEAGLDKLASASFSLQQEVFLAQAKIAEETNKPLIIHCVKSWSELIVLKKKLAPVVPWIIHGFRGNEVLSHQLIDHGFYLSFSEHFNPNTLRKEILSRIFLETDDRQTSIDDVYQTVSAQLNIEIESLALQISRNIEHVFSIE